MEKIDFVELATFCVNRLKESVEGDDCRYYINTLYCKIDEDDNIYTSTTPHILADATRCILVHTTSKKEVSNWYYWYHVEFINDNGEVLNRRLDDEFELTIRNNGGFANQWIYLGTDWYEEYYSHRWQDVEIKKVWRLYLLLRSTKNKEERRLIAKLFSKEESLLDMESEIDSLKLKTELLEKEKEMYKELLDQISAMVLGNSKE